MDQWSSDGSESNCGSGMSQKEVLHKYTQQLKKFMPEAAAPDIARWISDLKVQFVVSRPRRTKLGDYRVSGDGKNHRISVNGDLNPYSFLVTTIHEFAHMGCFLKHGHKVAPHGSEWKGIYTDLMHTFLGRDIFPTKLENSIRLHIARPKASSCSCPVLSKALVEYDENPATFLSDLKINDVFRFNDYEYRYLEKRRTRCLCLRIADRRRFLISVRANVETV